MVWNGVTPGIYTTWAEAKAQIEGFPNAKYKGFATQTEAVDAYRGNPADHLGILKSIVERRKNGQRPLTDPTIRLDAIAVDAACSKNPGPVEYQGVIVGTGEVVFRHEPIPEGTNNIGEYLALVHALALLEKLGDTTTPVYADSRTSMAWLRNRHSNTRLIPHAGNLQIMELLRRADAWAQAHPVIKNPVLKWNTELWGEIPADFGRKH